MNLLVCTKLVTILLGKKLSEIISSTRQEALAPLPDKIHFALLWPRLIYKTFR